MKKEDINNEKIENENINDEKGNDDRIDDEKVESIEKLGQITLPQFQSNILTLTIIGEIEGHVEFHAQKKSTKYEHIIPQLIHLEQNPRLEGCLLILNTMGGDVEAGLAISELVASLSKPTVSVVLGGGHSIGVPLSVCTNYSYIVPTATMTVHPIRMSGLVIGVSQSFHYFKKMQERILSFIINHSKISREKLIEMMLNTDELANDIGTILIGQSAVDIGLIDEVGGISDAINKLQQLIVENKENKNR